MPSFGAGAYAMKTCSWALCAPGSVSRQICGSHGHKTIRRASTTAPHATMRPHERTVAVRILAVGQQEGEDRHGYHTTAWRSEGVPRLAVTNAGDIAII